MHFDVIVAGLGTMGAATCSYLAGRGLKVLGIEQFDIPHDLGSHSGFTRIIRKAYYEHPGYVPLLQRSYELWRQQEQKTGLPLYHETGILYLGEPSSTVLTGSLESSRLYDIPVEKWDPGKARSLYPQFHFPEPWNVLWEPGAGYLDVNKSIISFYNSALLAKAVIHTREKIEAWKDQGDHISLKTSRDSYTASKLVITAGPWTKDLTAGLPLQVTRQVLAWLEMPDLERFSHPAFPCWFLHDPDQGMYYGFPVSRTGDPLEPRGIKLALHMPGEKGDPDRLDREVRPEDQDIIRYFLDRYLPGAKPVSIQYKTCMYTYSPDEHFIVDYLPGTDQKVAVACGFSGHGFKFAPVIAEILTDLALHNPPNPAAAFLGLKRLNP